MAAENGVVNFLIVSHSFVRRLANYALSAGEMNMQAAKCKWGALRHTCLLLLSVLGGMPASHRGMQARLFFVVDI